MTGTAGQASTFVATRGLILHYDFDETVGSVVHDRSASGRDGVVRGPAVWLSAGRVGGALKLAGGKGDVPNPQYVDMPVGTLNSLSEVTVSAWIRWDGGPTWQRVFDFGADLEHCFFYSPDGNGAGRTMVRTIAGSNNADLFMTARPLLGIWMHLAITWSPAALAVYMDGELVESAPATPFVPAPGVSPGSLGLTPRNFIGRSQAGVDPYFAGSIDEFRIYDRVLRKDEVVALRDYRNSVP